MDGSDLATEPSTRWNELATRKLPEVEELIERATALKLLLQAGIRCECVTIEACFGEGGCLPVRPAAPREGTGG